MDPAAPHRSHARGGALQRGHTERVPSDTRRRKECPPGSGLPRSSSSRSTPVRPPPRRPSVRRSASTASTSWSSARRTTPRPSRSAATSFRSRSRSTRTARSPSSRRPRRPRACCSRPPVWRRARASRTRPRSPRSPVTRSARSPRPRWPTSTPTTSSRPRRSSPAPPGRWASRSSKGPLCPPPFASSRWGPAKGPFQHVTSGRAGQARAPHDRAPARRGIIMAKHGKKFRAVAEKVDRDNLYSPLQAAKLAKETSTTSYDATVEVAMRLGVDPRKADQMVRGTVNLPHGTGKTARVIVFATGDKAAEAEAAGADVVGSDDLIERIQGGFLDFDAAIATPDQMAKVGRIARILGPRGLMPNPKTGTVTPDVTKAVNDIKGGKINFRVDKQANLHLVIGKTSFDEAKLVEKYAAALDEILRAKPSSAKGRYLKKVTVSTTMGPGIPVDPNRTRNMLVDEPTA